MKQAAASIRRKTQRNAPEKFLVLSLTLEIRYDGLSYGILPPYRISVKLVQSRYIELYRLDIFSYSTFSSEIHAINLE